MTQFAALLQTLSLGGVEFIVVGGVAAAAHGAARTTLDLDVVYVALPAISRALYLRCRRYLLIRVERQLDYHFNGTCEP
jgi:hypothetical protein